MRFTLRPFAGSRSAAPAVPAALPPLDWPSHVDEATHLAWRVTVAACWVDAEARRGDPVPVARANAGAIVVIERLRGMPLPAPLRHHHQRIGVRHLVDRLRAIVPSGVPDDAIVQPLLAAYPGFRARSTRPDDLALARDLIAFAECASGDELAFHRATGSVWLFAVHEGVALTELFRSTSECLDVCAMRCLARLHGDPATGDRLIADRFGPEVIDRWPCCTR
jgi:hypothetical protein